MKRAISLLCAASMLSGCYSMQGSERVLDKNGLITAEVPQVSVFRSDFDRAWKQRLAGPQVNQADIDAMLSSGFTHIIAYCDGYFDAMATQQRKSRVTRDAIAPISSLITGVIALHNFDANPGQAENLVAALGLATGATSAVLDIYDEHMLFGAENIGAVEKLTEAALSLHRSTVLQHSNLSFDAATTHLLDAQDVCSPQHILRLTREAIADGRVTARAVNDSRAAIAADGSERIDISVDNGN